MSIKNVPCCSQILSRIVLAALISAKLAHGIWQTPLRNPIEVCPIRFSKHQPVAKLLGAVRSKSIGQVRCHDLKAGARLMLFPF